MILWLYYVYRCILHLILLCYLTDCYFSVIMLKNISMALLILTMLIFFWQYKSIQQDIVFPGKMIQIYVDKRHLSIISVL